MKLLYQIIDDPDKSAIEKVRLLSQYKGMIYGHMRLCPTLTKEDVEKLQKKASLIDGMIMGIPKSDADYKSIMEQEYDKYKTNGNT